MKLGRRFIFGMMSGILIIAIAIALAFKLMKGSPNKPGAEETAMASTPSGVPSAKNYQVKAESSAVINPTSTRKFPPEFVLIRKQAIEKADQSLVAAQSLLTDFGDAELNQRTVAYQELSQKFAAAIMADDQAKIRDLAVQQGVEFPKMTRRVAFVSVENREKFNKYFFTIGAAWANLLQAGAGADLSSAESPNEYPEGSKPITNLNVISPDK